MTCVLVSLQSTSHTKPGISFPANSQNVSIILHPSVWQSSGMYIKKAGLLLLDWNSVNFGMVSSVSRITSAAVSSRPASTTSGARGLMMSWSWVEACKREDLQLRGERQDPSGDQVIRENPASRASKHRSCQVRGSQRSPVGMHNCLLL